MSIKYMTQAWGYTCPTPSEKLVLLALCDNANDEGHCWPSIETICRKCDIHRATAFRVLNKLEAAGVIEISNREYTSNMYHIFPKTNGEGRTELPVANCDGGSVTVRRGVVAGCDHNRHLNRQGTVSTYLKDALRIYEAYPRKVAKPKALESIAKAIKAGNDPTALLDLTVSFAEAVSKWPQEERKFIPHATTWFNQERFNDDPSTWEKTTTKPEPRKWGEQPTPEDRYLDHVMDQIRKI